MNNTMIDTVAIEKHARAMRAEFMRSGIRNLLARLRDLRHKGHATA